MSTVMGAGSLVWPALWRLLFLLSQVRMSAATAAAGGAALPNYTSEMVSFIQSPPSLEMESGDLGAHQRMAYAEGSPPPGFSEPRRRSTPVGAGSSPFVANTM